MRCLTLILVALVSATALASNCKVTSRGGGTYGVLVNGALVDGFHWTESGISEHLAELETVGICIRDNLPPVCMVGIRMDGTYVIKEANKVADSTHYTFSGIQEQMKNLVDRGMCRFIPGAAYRPE